MGKVFTTGMATMARRRWTITITADRHETRVSGWQAKEAAERAGGRPLWLSGARCWSVRRGLAADVCAAAESMGAAVVIIGQEVSTKAVAPPVLNGKSTQPEPTLFDVGGDVV